MKLRLPPLAVRPLLLLAILLSGHGAVADEIGLNVYGVSYHLDRRDSRGRPFNEINPGLGLNLSLYESRRTLFFAEGGSFEDSFRQHARYLALGWRYKVIAPLSIGLMAGYYHSRSVNYNQPILALIPMISGRVGNLSAHLVHLPAYGHINPYPSLGMYFTWHMLDLR